jgi:hypothetical protein
MPDIRYSPLKICTYVKNNENRNKRNIPVYKNSKIVVIFPFHKERGDKIKNKVHTILTFEAESKIVYLELTFESKKNNYGKEIIFDSIENLVIKFQNDGVVIEDVTDKLIVGEPPFVLLNKIKN